MHTAVSFTTLSARGTRFRMVPKAYVPGGETASGRIHLARRVFPCNPLTHKHGHRGTLP